MTNEFDIAKLITISSAHIDEDTAKLLDAEPESNSMGLVVYNKADYGWFIFLSEYITKKNSPDRKKIPSCLLACIDLAHEMGCEWLCIDTDGPVYDGLQKYN